jgi:hypothetical protein
MASTDASEPDFCLKFGFESLGFDKKELATGEVLNEAICNGLRKGMFTEDECPL